jgi:hypothetical protein
MPSSGSANGTKTGPAGPAPWSRVAVLRRCLFGVESNRPYELHDIVLIAGTQGQEGPARGCRLAVMGGGRARGNSP